MIIICKECSTKFELDESLLKETGSNVRCSECKNIFTVYPPQSLGKPETPPAIPAQQGYFDSEEELSPSGSGGFKKSDPEDDEDGLELDVGEEDEDEEFESDGLDIGDSDTNFDDGGIDLGSGMPGMNTGMSFDEDELGDDGVPGMDMDNLTLETEINANLDQGDNLELDAASAPKKEPAKPEPDPIPDTEPEIDEDLDADEDDFEFEFELDEDEDEELATEELEEEELEEKVELEVEEDMTLDEPLEIQEDFEEAEQDVLKTEQDDFELSIYDDEDPDKKTEKSIEPAKEKKENTSEEPEPKAVAEDSSEYESMELEIDDSDDLEDDFDSEEYEEIEDEEYEIEEYEEDDDNEYEDDDIIDEEYEDDSASGKKGKKPAKKSGKLLKVLVAILMLIVVGYGAFKVTNGFTKGPDLSKINFSILKNLLNFSDMDEVPVWATINNQSLNGRYVNNELSGKLFVITGKITNESSIPLNSIQVEGTLIAKGGVVAKKKRVFCGNDISEGELSTWSVGAMNRHLQRESGEQNSNLNIEAHKSIPFMVVFSNLPSELENYTVTVTSFKRIKK